MGQVFDMRTRQPVEGIRQRKPLQLDVLTEDDLDENSGAGFIGGERPYAVVSPSGKGICFDKKTGMLLVQHLIELMNSTDGETG